MRLLVSARDAGAANSIAPIVNAAKEVRALTVDLVAQPPASAIFAAHGFNARPVDLPPAASRDCDEALQLRAAAASLIRNARPDAILTGLSGPDLGIDEALIAEAPNSNTYSVQDYPGWVVPGFGRPARTYIVADVDSAELARARGVPRTIVSGYLSYCGYDQLNMAALRADARANLPANASIIGFFGQPLELAGYRRSLRALGEAVASLDRAAALVHRPHPRQTPAAVAADASALTEGYRAAPIARPGLSTLGLLAACDVAVSCFSSVGMDLAVLNRLSPAPLGAPLFLIFAPDLRAMLRADSGEELPWAARLGVALAAESRDGLKAALTEAFDPRVVERLWANARAKIALPKHGVAAVIRDILREASCVG